MTLVKPTRKVYSAEELHRLKGSQSQPKLQEAIEEKDGEDAEIVKEHVLRGSKSFAARSYRSRASGNPLRVPSNKSNNENMPADNSEADGKPMGLQPPPNGLILGEIVPNGQTLRPGPFKLRPSPTPSLKRKKAEAIVKAHGSPTHVRVTAGGRIVPSEQSPLCHPRFGYSAIQANGGLIKSIAPNHQAGKSQWTRATENGFVAQDIEGNLCQIVDGTIMPLQEVNGALQLYMEAPNVHGSSHGQFNAALAPHRPQQQTALRSAGAIAPAPNTASQINALELQYAKLEHELKDVDKTEVIHGRGMGKGFKDGLVARRRALVTKMDQIRKALKTLRSQPPPNAPTSPRAMATRQSVSPQRQGPGAMAAPFHRQRPTQMFPAPIAPPHGPYLPSGVFAPQFTTPSPEEVYTGQRWDVPPAGMFMQPPPFDGSMGPAFQMMPPLASAPLPHDLPPVNQTHQGESIPQHDGSFADVNSQTPNRNHAVSLRAPESKATNTKSVLNPMSPAYKPAATNASTHEQRRAVTSMAGSSVPLFPMHLQCGTQRSSAGTDDTISPAKKDVHMHSSSIASFNTADFFPRNTGEYSTRQQEHRSVDRSDHKDNNWPEEAVTISNKTVVTPGQEDISPHRFRAPAVPPGTPVDSARKVSQPMNLPCHQDGMPDRNAHNVSPKSKREWLFVQERPEQSRGQSDPSPPVGHSTDSEIGSVTKSCDTLALLDKSREWIEGFQAGLQRKHIGDRAGDSLNGYVAGLLKSTPATTAPGSKTLNGSPTRSTTRRPSPALPSRSSSRLMMPEHAYSARQPFEMNMQNMDTLKQAVYAPQNENAILTPAPDGPHVTGVAQNLGTWAKNNNVERTIDINDSARITDVPNFPVPSRTSSVRECQNVKVKDMANGKQHPQMKELPAVPDFGHHNGNTGACLQLNAGQFSAGLMPPNSPTLSTMSIASSSIAAGGTPNTGHRVTSISSMDSSMQRQWPGSRIMTPSEWKSGSSVAHAAGLATGYFAHTQFDGSQDTKAPPRLPGQLVDMSGKGTMQPLQRVTSITSTTSSGPKHGRFHEGSLDGMSSPPMSPQRSPSPSMSPNVTPRATPRENGKKKDSSPAKGSSPAKAQFHSIAEKVGIKVATTTNGKSPDAVSGPAA